jgi:phospholipase/carboxylesterase
MSEVKIDDAVVVWAVDGQRVSAERALVELARKPLLLLMHGFGSFEGDLISLAAQLPTGFVCASPRAPLTAPPPIVNGFAWWPLPLNEQGLPLRQPDTEYFEGSGPHVAAVALLEWLSSLDERVRTANSSATAASSGLGTVALFGFSQGGCMVTSLLRLSPERFVCGVNCSGFVAPGAFGRDARLAELRPPMFWGRDEADPIIDAHRIALTSAWAPTHTRLEARLYDGIFHGIGAEELRDISDFLVKHVPEAANVTQ